MAPFPSWFRCTRCNQLLSLDSGAFTFDNKYASRPFDAQFRHKNCFRGKDYFAVPARFLLGCLNGHLDEFPYAWFVHQGGPCPQETYPALTMTDQGGTEAANVRITCKSCGAAENMNRAQGRKGMERLPVCRGRHPHLNRFDTEQCPEPSRLLILGASNQWFGKNVLTLSVPATQGRQLDAALERLWERLQVVTSREVMAYAYEQQFFNDLGRWSLDEVWAAMEARRSGGTATDADPGDLLGPEWEVLTQVPPGPADEDFSIRQVPVPGLGQPLVSDLRQVERLRLVRALVGFSRFDAPDAQEPDLVTVAPLGRGKVPEWVPATEVRGEGIFVRLDERAVSDWEQRLAATTVGADHRRAFERFRRNRYSDRRHHPADYDWGIGWPGLRYYLVHTMAHITLRAIALECGYAAASLGERIYASRAGAGTTAGFLIYTAVPDAEGTLGGLVSLGETDRFARILARALDDARECSSDPLCAERAPVGDSDALHAAACHVCLFLSETSCERGNRFVDRRLLVPVGEDPALAYWAET